MLDLSFWDKFFILIIGMSLGFFFLLKPLLIVNIIGKSSWAESHILGGTYGAVKLFGIAIMVVTIITVIG
jgi:hypothetical protein